MPTGQTLHGLSVWGFLPFPTFLPLSVERLPPGLRDLPTSGETGPSGTIFRESPQHYGCLQGWRSTANLQSTRQQQTHTARAQPIRLQVYRKPYMSKAEPVLPAVRSPLPAATGPSAQAEDAVQVREEPGVWSPEHLHCCPVCSPHPRGGKPRSSAGDIVVPVTTHGVGHVPWTDGRRVLKTKGCVVGPAMDVLLWRAGRKDAGSPGPADLCCPSLRIQVRSVRTPSAGLSPPRGSARPRTGGSQAALA